MPLMLTFIYDFLRPDSCLLSATPLLQELYWGARFHVPMTFAFQPQPQAALPAAGC